MLSTKKVIGRYVSFIVHHPYIVLLLVIILLIFASYESSFIRNKSMDNRDMLPSGYEVIDAFNVFETSFGSSDTIKIAIELDPSYIDSKEPRDIRDFEVLQYIDLLSQAVLHVDDVSSASSASTLLKAMGSGKLPRSNNEIKALISSNPSFVSYISSDYTMALISISLDDGYVAGELVSDINNIIDETPKPSYIKAQASGELAIDPVIEEIIGPDMGRTSMFSLLGIILIIIIVFRSIRYGILPLLTIVIGVMLAFGFIGLMRMEMSSATSGVMSMIMGIGIDFGIQTVMRFRQELKNKSNKGNVERSMIVTMENVFMPMATTTLAALVGFKAMSMGQLTFLAEMATMMSYGIAACFVAAITAVPALLVITENFMLRFRGWRAQNR